MEARILEKTRQAPPDGSTHWSTRKLGRAAEDSSQPRRAKRGGAPGLQPHRFERYMQSDDPDFETQSRGRDRAVCESARPCGGVCRRREDGDSGARPLSIRCCRCRPAAPSGMGSSTTATARSRCSPPSTRRSGEVLGQTVPRHTSAAFVDFLGDIVAAQPRGREIHVIADNLSTHKTQAVRTLPARPSATCICTSRRPIRRGSTKSNSGLRRSNATSSPGASSRPWPTWRARFVATSGTTTKTPKPIRWSYRNPAHRIGSTSVSTGH